MPVLQYSSILSNSMAKAIDETISSHILVPPRVKSVSSFAKGSVSQNFAETAPEAIYLTWKEDPTSTMIVQWITKTEDQATTLCYRKDSPSGPWINCSGIEIPFPEKKPYIYHAVFLSGLESDSSYQFQIKGYSVTHKFITMPRDIKKPISFVIGGDVNLSDTKLFDETTKEAMRHNPAFIALGGDLACAASGKYKDEKCEKWIAFLSHYYATSQRQDGTLTPLIVAIGNHEVKGSMGRTYREAPFFYRLFASPGLRGFNALRFGRYLSLYILDSGHTHTVSGNQATWLSEEMQHDVGMLHKIALYHIPAYPDVRSYRSREFEAIRKYFVPIFDRYHLHLAFENHEHAYKRTIPLINHSYNIEGTIYIGNGSWGVHPRKPKKTWSTTYLEKAISARAFTVVTLEQTKRTTTAVSFDGTVIDSFTQDVDYVRALRFLKREQILFDRMIKR